MASILALVNHKGGVGKTTTAVNLAALFAQSGPTLLVDCDGQGSAAISLGMEPWEGAPGTADVMLEDVPIGTAIMASPVDGLDVVMGTQQLLLADLRLAYLDRRDRRLQDALRPVRGRYDTIILDLPPSLGLVALNGLIAADWYIAPCTPKYLDARGINSLTYVLSSLAALPGVGKVAACLGYLITTVDRRPNRAITEIMRQLRDAKGVAVFDTIIPMAGAVANAPSFGRPVVLHDPESTGAVAYRDLYVEVLTRMHKERA